MKIRNLNEQQKQSLFEYLEAIRKALIISIIAIFVAAMICFSYNEQLMNIVMFPLKGLNQKLLVTGITEAFFVKLQLSLLAGIVAAFPIVAWVLWSSIKSLIDQKYRKYIYWLFPITVFLFVIGILFSYYVILPMVLKFFVFIAGKNLDTMFKVDQYVSFVMAFTLPFGIVFEMPVVVFFLSSLGLVTYELLAKNRKYALLIIVILAAALTPGPDPISQIMMAIPMYVLYEISIWVAWFVEPDPEMVNNNILSRLRGSI